MHTFATANCFVRAAHCTYLSQMRSFQNQWLGCACRLYLRCLKVYCTSVGINSALSKRHKLMRAPYMRNGKRMSVSWVSETTLARILYINRRSGPLDPMFYDLFALFWCARDMVRYVRSSNCSTSARNEVPGDHHDDDDDQRVQQTRVIYTH